MDTEPVVFGVDREFGHRDESVRQRGMVMDDGARSNSGVRRNQMEFKIQTVTIGFILAFIALIVTIIWAAFFGLELKLAAVLVMLALARLF